MPPKVTEKQAGVREEAGVDSQQVAGLAEPLPAALQERLHFPVQSDDVGEDFSVYARACASAR